METIILDPNEEVPNRVEFDLTPYVGGAGPDFGEAAVEAYFADADLGQEPIAYRQMNRAVTVPLVLHGRTDLTFDQLRSLLQSKVGLWQRKGGVIKRETSIGPVYADVMDARLKFGGSTAQAMQEVDVDAVLSLEVKPDWYGEEIDLGTETGSGEVIRVLEPERGDHPGRVRIVVTDTEGAARNGVLWGIRSHHYDSAATAALVYEAEDLTLLDAATVVTITGAAGGGSNNAVRHASLATDWTPVLSTDIDATGAMTHTGSYRVFARVYTTSAVPPRVRLAWDVGDLTSPTFNPPAVPLANNFYVLDLGEIRLDQSPTGTHRWRGQIQAIGAAGGENIAIDRVLLQPLDEYAGVLRSVTANDIGVLQDFAARDGFDQSAGSLTGKTLPVGGTWAGAGDSDDFAVEANGTAQRTASADISTGIQFGRFAVAGSTSSTTTFVQADMSWDSAFTGSSGVFARYTDTNNFLLAALAPSHSVPSHLTIYKRVLGATTALVASLPVGLLTEGDPYTLRLVVDLDGNVWVFLFTPGSAPGNPCAVVQDADLATGGPLASGIPGFWNWAFGTGLPTRTFDNFAARLAELDAVIHPSRALHLTTDGAHRENSDGASAGPVGWVSGDLPRLPAPGLESQAAELLVSASRGDLDRLPDISPDDDLSVQVLYRPSYLYVPDGGPGS